MARCTFLTAWTFNNQMTHNIGINLNQAYTPPSVISTPRPFFRAIGGLSDDDNDYDKDDDTYDDV